LIGRAPPGGRDQHRCAEGAPARGCRTDPDGPTWDHRRASTRGGRVEAGGGPMDDIVRARGVRKVYRNGSEVEALRGVDLNIPAGELVAIVGPSESGKTTLLNCLSGLERIDGREILVGGADLSSLSDNDRTEYRAKSMGFVFQAFNLLPVLSAVENEEIRLLLLGIGARETRARALETLELVGLGGRGSHRPDQLSGGEQQRRAAARALVHRPAVGWADEPTGNLDSESTQAVM